ncbi:MAG TPA: FAD-dependent oxidoreductase [Candidatus Saccharimonadales bacterium]|nr:FAD-dependent oxidoreductase [Candidatus Saccharimonadales bacterium]
MLAIKQKFDTFLAGLSMYLLVTLALFLLFGVALTYSFLGVTTFHPIDIIPSLTLFMGISFGASYVFAYLFSVSAHHKSALITGGILFCIFSPTLSVSNLLIYALVAVFAVASKYLLVWRSRHIFNPAAVAAVIISLTGLQGASWWMADASFAVPVTILALIILYKTERLEMGGIFFASYIVTLSIAAIFHHQSVGDLLVVSLAVWWPLFFVGFMVSEPLTLPSRRYQVAIVAIVVAVLAGLHPSFGPIYVTPEIALIVGNIVSFGMTRRVGVKLKLVRRERFAGGQELFEFEPMRKFVFKAGQHLELSLPHAKADLRGERRQFTIASAPESKTIKLTTRYAQKTSTFKAHLKTLKIGQTITAAGVKGDFLLPKDSNKKLLFVAGGIGITPFRAFVESLRLREQSRDIVLIYAVRAEKEVLFKDIFNVKSGVKQIVVAPDAGQNHIRATGITKELLKDAVTDIDSRHVYISGPPPMVAAVASEVTALGAASVTKDSFTGY